jgi:hypothetical protein
MRDGLLDVGFEEAVERPAIRRQLADKIAP